MMRSRYLAAALLLGLITPFLAGRQVSAAPEGHTSYAPVKVARVARLGPILVTAKGFTLYYFSKERPGSIACTGSCAQVWPPLLVPAGSAPPRSVPGATGKFGTIVRPDKSRQITYNHRALYTYTPDTKPGQALCQAMEGWYVVKVHGS